MQIIVLKHLDFFPYENMMIHRDSYGMSHTLWFKKDLFLT